MELAPTTPNTTTHSSTHKPPRPRRCSTPDTAAALRKVASLASRLVKCLCQGQSAFRTFSQPFDSIFRPHHPLFSCPNAAGADWDLNHTPAAQRTTLGTARFGHNHRTRPLRDSANPGRKYGRPTRLAESIKGRSRSILGHRRRRPGGIRSLAWQLSRALSPWPNRGWIRTKEVKKSSAKRP